MRVLLLKKEKKKDSRSPIFWLYILACILCCFVCFNKHTRTRVQNFKLCCKFMFRQILSSNCLQIFKAPCGRKWTKGLPNVGHMLQCHLCMPSNSKSPSIFYSRHLKCSVCVVTYSILMSSSHVQKNINVSQIWCAKFTVDAASSSSPAPIRVCHTSPIL